MNTLDRAPRWDKNRSIFLKLGFVLSLGFAFMAFNYTTYDRPEEVILDAGPIEDDWEVTPPIMRPERQLPPPPPEKIELPDEIVELDQPEFIEDLPAEEPVESTETKVELTEITNDQPAPPEPPKLVLPTTPEEADEIVVIAERMPTYNTCDLNLSEKERRSCTQKAMLSQIYSQLKYPSIARENGIEGTVVVGFVINKKGELQDLDILKEIGGGCGREVLRVIKTFDTFHPGKQNGRPVSVMYRIPVKFELQK